MRIAVAGTHCSGKSTLIDVFLIKHADYIHEPEAHEALQELHGYTFAAEPIFNSNGLSIIEATGIIETRLHALEGAIE